MLKITDVKLELLNDIDMINFFKNNIHGGKYHCSVRKVTCNHKFFENFDPMKPSSYIMYIDAKNLYGYSMRQLLPEREDKLMKLMFVLLPMKKIMDMFFEVKMEYPEDLYNKHNEIPFLPENIYSPISKKLIYNLNRKGRYVLQYMNMKQAIRNGWKLRNKISSK